MPTIHRFHGLRVVIYPNDHRPPHVHVMGKACEAVFKLNGLQRPPELRENYGFSARELTLIESEIGEHQENLQTQWGAIHGY